MKVLKWIPALFIFSASWYLSSQETIEHLPSFWNADKLVHCLCFAGLSFWVSFACNISVKKQFWIPSVIVSVYGIIDEIHQSFTPGRSCSVFDWIADTVGALLGAFIFLFLVNLICRLRARDCNGAERSA
ncbi:MAG: VanZ family protein [Treponema sp.]|nr:VanZ family protein [Treponema sp.]